MTFLCQCAVLTFTWSIVQSLGTVAEPYQRSPFGTVLSLTAKRS